MGGGSGIGSGAPISPCSDTHPGGSGVVGGIGLRKKNQDIFKDRDAKKDRIDNGNSTSSNALRGGHLQTIASSKTLEYNLSSEEKLLNPQQQHPPVGLKNVGNTCYANAALQCLLNTALSHALLDPATSHIFRRYSSNPDLLSAGSGSVDSEEDEDEDEEARKKRREVRQRSREIRRKKREQLLSQEKCQWLTGTLTDIASVYTAGSNFNHSYHQNSKNKQYWSNLFHLFAFDNDQRIVDPSGITRHVHKLSPCLRPYQQEDAHEFIRSLLSTLTLDGQNKQLSSLFDGLLESAVTCKTCHRASITRDRYMDLSLDIQEKEVTDLTLALHKFTQTETLDKDNKVFCTRCNKKRNVSKGLRLATAPSILVCHLKRFAFDIYGRATRLSKYVAYPLTLHIENFMSRANQGKPAPYELVGVVVHAGQSCERGHYYAYVKSGDNWYKANDEIVTQVSVETVLRQQAYILIYEVAGMRANHGFYGCGRYHLTRSKSQKKRVENLAAMQSSDERTVEGGSSLAYSVSTGTCEDNNKSGNSAESNQLSSLLDSFITFCGSTSAAEAVRDAICDSENKASNTSATSTSCTTPKSKNNKINTVPASPSSTGTSSTSRSRRSKKSPHAHHHHHRSSSEQRNRQIEKEASNQQKSEQVVSCASSESNFSRTTAITLHSPSSDDLSSRLMFENKSLRSLSRSMERVRSSSDGRLSPDALCESDIKWNVGREITTYPYHRDSSSIATGDHMNYINIGNHINMSHTHSRSRGDLWKYQIYPSATSLTTDSQLIKSVSSNNLQEREEEAATGYEKESAKESFSYGPLPYKSQYDMMYSNDKNNNNDDVSDPGGNVVIRRRQSNSAPRAGWRNNMSTSAPSRFDKRIDLPPLPTGTENKSRTSSTLRS
mmetsp:Transcript_1717/g.2100  ORF Transcript_1717/g.2100 Transcript_1717/m.2100 type:complete len:892 (+) Transcript_1717:310-2985(+)